MISHVLSKRWLSRAWCLHAHLCNEQFLVLMPGEEPGTLHSLSLQILQMMMVYTISHDSTIDTETNLRWKKLCRLSDGWKKASTMTLSTATPRRYVLDSVDSRLLR
jgi:hypothetical protein